MTTLTESQVRELLAVFDNKYAANIEKFNAAFAIARPLAESWLEMRELLKKADAEISSLFRDNLLDNIHEDYLIALGILVTDIRNAINADSDNGDHEPRDTGDSPGEIANRQAEAQKLKR